MKHARLTAMGADVIAARLRDAPSLRSAVNKLETSETSLRAFCRRTPELRKAFDQAKARGLSKATSTRNHHLFLQSLPSNVLPWRER